MLTVSIVILLLFAGHRFSRPALLRYQLLQLFIGFTTISIVASFYFDGAVLKSQSALLAVEEEFTPQVFPLIPLDEVHKAVKNADFLIVDTRTEADFKLGHIPGAINVPPNQRYELLTQFERTNIQRTIIVYCASSDCTWSDQTAKLFWARGCRTIYVFRGGWREWQQRQNKLV